MVDHVYEEIDAEGRKTESCVLTEEKLYATDIFRIYCFKVLPCCKLYNHNWKTCPFLHEGEKAGRRDPQKYRYVGIECQDAKKGECERGDSCPYAHNLFEFWLHPSRYRTQLCNKPSACRRKVCFFAHSVKELRHPSMGTADPEGYVQQTVHGAEAFQREELPSVGEAASPETLSDCEQKTPSSSPQRCRCVAHRCASFPSHDGSRDFAPPMRSRSASLPSTLTSDSMFKESQQKIAPLRDTPTPRGMSPTILAFRTPYDSQGENEPTFSLCTASGSILPGTADPTAAVWKMDSSSDDWLTNSNSVMDDGDI